MILARRGGAARRSGVLKQQAPRTGGVASRRLRGVRHRSCPRLSLSVPAAGDTDSYGRGPSTAPSGPVIRDRFAACVSAMHRGVRQLTVAWGRPVGAPPRTRRFDRAMVFDKSRDRWRSAHDLPLSPWPVPCRSPCTRPRGRAARTRDRPSRERPSTSRSPSSMPAVPGTRDAAKRHRRRPTWTMHAINAARELVM